MADVKTVRGTLNGVMVETSEANAERLDGFEPEKKSTKKSTSSKPSKSK